MPATGNPRLGARVNRPYILAQSAVPVCLVSSGTMGNNGALSGITALPTTYSGGIWLRLPANAIQAGSAAGLYWAIMSSTTAGTVYNVYADPASPFTPYVPATNTPFVSTGPGAFTQTTASDITLVNVTVPGGAMGPNGQLRAFPLFQSPNTANNRIAKALFAGGSLFSQTMNTGTANVTPLCRIKNRGVNNRQVTGITTTTSLASNNPPNITNYNIDTSVDQSFTLTGQLAVATDYLMVEGFDVEVLPS